MIENYHKFDTDLDKRRQDCQKLLEVTARNSAAAFKTCITKKGGSGQLIFDHTGQSLEMKVRLVSQRKGSYDPTNLSGGEGSLTQLCFLMALFQDTAGPFHILDEIDVFLDHPNRHTLFKNLNDMTRELDKQWIFLTPHDTKCIQRGEHIKVMEMVPPPPNQRQINEYFEPEN